MSTAMSTTFTSLNSGLTWAGSTMMGLPTGGTLPYQTYASTINVVPSITAITAAASGTNQLAITSNDLVYTSVNSGATFSPTGLGQNNSPFIYIPFDGSVTDVMGNATTTVNGSVSYVPGKVGTNAVSLLNTAGSSGNTASNYIRYTVPSNMTSFTISGWFNSQTTVTTGYPTIISMYSVGIYLILAPVANQPPQLFFAFPSGSGNGQNGIQTTCGIATNTWYSFTIIYQIGTCSLYLNGALVGTGSSTGLGTFTGSTLGLGCYDTNTNQPFSGYIDDFRLYNYAVTNPSGAALINPLVGPIAPYVYVTFDGSTTTDLMGNSTVTATGSPGFVAGQVGSNALDLSTNTAGGTAGKYLSGTWAGTSNFTVSGWFNAQAIPASSVGMIFSAGTGATTAFQAHITSGGIFTIYSSAAYATSTITTNTWYFFQVVYQSSGTCYVYLNGTQVTTFSGTALSPIPTIFNIGVYTHTAAVGAFKGYIDDIRIYNGAFTPAQLNPVLYSPSYAIGSPNIYLPFENGSVLDVMGYSAVSARGTMNFVPGVVGSTALNLVNPASGTVVNYLRGSWAGSPNFTVSFWFNAQSLGASTNQVIFAAYSGAYAVYINTSNQILIYLPSGGTALNAITGPVISINTWYYVTAIFQTNGTCALYLNNTLAGTYTNTGGVGSYTTAAFGIATYDALVVSAFNGYIDDFKLYNCAVPFNALGPMNYTQAALSNSGAYQVVAAANGGVYTSANSGSSWSQTATASLQPVAAVNTVGGQLITPQLTGLAAYTWTQNGVNWAVSSSSIYSGAYSYFAFNNTLVGTTFASSGSYTGSGATQAGSPSTTVSGLSAQVGEWLQIQSSVPIVMNSYIFSCGGTLGYQPKTYIIVGSNDGTNWYPIQSASFSGNAYSTVFTSWQQNIIVNLNGAQTVTAQNTVTATTVTYSTTTNSYTFFRVIATATYGGLFELGEWNINFATPATPLYVAPSASSIGSLSAITVMPQQTGLVSNTWIQNGVSYVASASATYNASTLAYCAFNPALAATAWAGAAAAYSSSSPYAYTANTYSTTILGGVGTIPGDWLQLQTSVPVIMNSYTWQSSGTAQQPKNYYIVGSNDGTSWYPIQYATGNTTPFTANVQLCTTYLLVTSTTITQTIQGGQTGSFTTVGYPTSTNSYTYFRLVVTNTWGYANGNTNVGQWFINFTAYTPSLLQTLAMSPTGAHMMLTGVGATTPTLAGLATSTWTANGVSWTASASTTYTTYTASNAFNNLTTTGNTWLSTGNYNAAGTTYNGSASTTVLGTIGIVSGEWLQIQASIPLVLQSYTFACGGQYGFFKTYYIVGSTDGINWYPVHYMNLTTNPFTADFTSATTYLSVNYTGPQTIQGNITGSGTSASYPTSTSPYTYFRFIKTQSWSYSGVTAAEIGELYLNFQSAPTFYSTDYGSNWTRALSAATVFNANVLAISGNGQYSLQGYGQTVTLVSNTFAGYGTGTYTTPTFSPALSSALNSASISATGQYMVLVTQGTTNNVYYSTNYGVSFTGATFGSSPMVSCAMSADGTYMTVANATQVYTLNRNTQGFNVTLGNSAGVINQGQNAIAIGNQAGVTNQSVGSIILNGTGSAVNSYVPGFFVSPVASSGSSVSGSFAILGYGSDSQVVQTGMTVLSSGYVGIGTTNPAYTLDVVGTTRITGPLTVPYFLWHFNWSSFQYIGVVGSTGMVNSINNTNIAGAYINTPSPGQFTVPHSGVYLCTFDATTTVDARSIVLLRINGVYYNPYAATIGNYAQMTYTDVVYLTAGQVVDWYCSLGGVQYTSVLLAGNGSGKGISFALMR